MTQYYSRTDIPYAGDSNFTIPFSYIDKTDIHVYINDTLISTWVWLNDSQINITSTLSAGDVVSIRRITPIDEKIVTYQNMSMVLNDDNLNLSQDQVLNAVQEVYDNNVSFQIDVNAQIDEIDTKVDTANATANQALSNSETAISIANEALSNSEDAVATANAAETKADNAVSTANTASSNASQAVSTANNANTNAQAAVSTANSAADDASEALSKANTAISTANTAKDTADTAKDTADTALADSATAVSNSETAISTANAASTAANNAVSTANTASTNASTAVSTANSAASAASTAVSTANSASTAASNAVSTANTASTNASTAINKADEAIAIAQTAVSQGITPATTSQIGGIIVGTNLSITAEGVLSADAQSITVDNALSTTSENPVQNKVITDTLNGYVKSSELPTIGNGTIIVKEGATEKGRFTLNQTGDTTINLTQVGAGMITFMQDGKQSGRMSANRATDMTITLKGLYDYESVNADMIGDNLEQANNNRVTGFSSSDYIVMREPITLPQYWEYDVDFSLSDTAEGIGDEQYIFSDENNTFALKENEDAELFETFTLYVNGTPVASDIEAESAYYNIKFIKGMDENYNIVGSGNTLQCYVYVGYSSSAQKELVGSFTASTAPTTIQTIFGVNSNHAKPLSDGSYIDFTKCFIDGITRSGNTVTKTRVWDGLVRTIDTKVNTWDLEEDLANIKGLYDYYVINASKQGSIVIDGANASGFSANNLVWTSYTAPSVNEVTAIDTQFTVNALNGSDQFIFSDSYNSPNFAVKIASNNCLSVAVGGTWYPVATAEILGSETYQVRLIDWIYTDGITSIGTYLYVYSPSLNEVIYNGLVTSNTVSLSNGRTFHFGTGNSGASPLNGSIDLSQTYIEQNDIANGGTFDSGWYTVWTGATPVIDTKADKVDYVAKVGDTMTGNLKISKETNSAALNLQRNDCAIGDVATGNQINVGSLSCYDRNNNNMSIIQTRIGTDGSTGIQLALRKHDLSGYNSVAFSTLPDGSAVFDFPKCTTQATTTSTASSAKVAVIVKNYVNGGSWYRIWSDGWCEQGGLTSISGSGTTISFTKTFINTNFNFVATAISGDGTWAGVYIYSRTASNIQLRLNSSNYTKTCSWKASGYLATGQY